MGTFFDQFGEKFEKQLLGEVKFQMYAVDKKEVYLSAPQNTNIGQLKFLKSPEAISFANEDNGVWKLDDLVLRHTPYNEFFWKTSENNLTFKEKASLSFPYSNVTYSISMHELIDFSEKRSIYGGRLYAITDQTLDKKNIILANHGAFVARPHEPSLTRFSQTIALNRTKNEKIQALLDFVTMEIPYDNTEGLGSVEVLKKPNEVLFTKRSDCSGKTILLASLLEQLDVDYLLLYSDNHINVAVLQEGFPELNVFEWEGKKWTLAETTLEGFQIGKTAIKDVESLTKKVLFVQRPSHVNEILRANTHQPLPFR